MGYINVQVGGSFDNSICGTRQFDAMESGHAVAVGEAIAWLASLLPEAVRHDHQLHSEGVTPRDGFRVKGAPDGSDPTGKGRSLTELLREADGVLSHVDDEAAHAVLQLLIAAVRRLRADVGR